MNDENPISVGTYKLAAIFAHPSDSFELTACPLYWQPPCWLGADILLAPKAKAAREEFLFNPNIPHKWDAFAKASWEDQLWEAFCPHYHQICGPHADGWLKKLWRCYEALKHSLKATDSLFSPPFRFANRDEFHTVDLSAILKGTPNAFSIYLASEKRSYRSYNFLRIHSSPPFTDWSPKCLWFEKRLPDGLHPEDVLPWFAATIQRLPKKDRPAELGAWTKQLLYFESQLVPPSGGAHKPWAAKPKAVFVFGSTAKVGYRSLTHFERRDINQIVRQTDTLRITGKERFNWGDGETMEIERTIFLLAFDDAAAQRVERQLLSGERIHFGLDADVLGMISRSEDYVHAINAPLESVRRFCDKPGLELRLISNPRDKHKTYTFVKPGETGPG